MAAFVGQTGKWPAAQPFKLTVLAEDNRTFGRIYSADLTASAEVVVAEKNGEGVDAKTLVIPIGFPTLDQAERAGKILADAFAAVRVITAETPRKEDDGHRHQFELARINRALDYHAICRDCGADLGDVKFKRGDF